MIRLPVALRLQDENWNSPPHIDPNTPPPNDNIDDNPSENVGCYFLVYYTTVSIHFGHGETFLDAFDKDKFSHLRKTNLYYPFCSRGDWQVTSYLHNSGLSMALIDELLSLELVGHLILSKSIFLNLIIILQIKNCPLSFQNAKELRGRIELLPSGPPWNFKELPLEYPTKMPVSVYYRNPIECLRCLMLNPLVSDHIEFKPYRVYKDSQLKDRVFTEWLSGDVAWNMQVKYSLLDQ